MLFETAIRDHALANAPNEACGLVVRDGDGELIAKPCPNVASDPARFFAIDPREFLAAKKNSNLVGYYHSHPESGPEASDADKDNARHVGLPSWIYSIPAGVLGCYIPEGKKTPLEGREFCPMVHDCISLVWDFYEAIGIRLPFFPRTQDDYLTGTAFDWRPWMRDYGARFVNEPEAGDILLIATGDSQRPNHLGVMLGGGVFLHQRLEMKSQRDVWGGYWKRQTQLLIRVPGAREGAHKWEAAR